jgi:hypothetical protein
VPESYRLQHKYGHVRLALHISGGSGILASILVLLLQGLNVLTIPSKLKNHSKKKGERKYWKKKKENWRKKFRARSRLDKIEEI